MHALGRSPAGAVPTLALAQSEPTFRAGRGLWAQKLARSPPPSPSLDADFPDRSAPCPLWPLPFLTYTRWPLTSTLPKLCPPWLLPSALLTPDLSDFAFCAL